jgi:4-methyl-5(b-hydroxyethyl)-thiazole monophosphate biosynthesis
MRRIAAKYLHVHPYLAMITKSILIGCLMFVVSSVAGLRHSRLALGLQGRSAIRLMMSTNDGSMVKKVLVPVANGSEEIETTTIVDTLVRGGASVTVASVEENSLQVTCSRGIKLVADKFMHECAADEWDMIVCPGGMPGAERLRDSAELKAALLKQASEGKYYAAVCAAPAVVLQTHGLLEGKSATCYPAPAFIDKLATRSDDKVVVDGNVITSQGPSTTLAFSIKLVEALFGTDTANTIAKQMLL